MCLYVGIYVYIVNINISYHIYIQINDINSYTLRTIYFSFFCYYFLGGPSDLLLLGEIKNKILYTYTYIYIYIFFEFEFEIIYLPK